MKKIILAILALTILLSFSGCRTSDMFDTQPSDDLFLNQGAPPETASEDPTEEISTETNAPTDTPETQPPVTTPPATETPATAPPTTEVPATTPPTTDPPATEHTHSWANATCTAPKTCKTCKVTVGKTTDHSWNAATCTVPKTCKICKETEGKATGHNWNAATCTTPKTCSVCGTTEGSAVGHNWTTATCTIPKTCSVCGATEGCVADHSWNDATCTAPKTCSKCEATSGDKLSHDYQDGACVVCESRQLGYGDWYFVKQDGDKIFLYIFYFKDGNGSGSAWVEAYKDESTYTDRIPPSSGIIYEGKRYAVYSGVGDPCYFEATDDEITIHFLTPEENRSEMAVLKRVAKDQMMVTHIIDDYWIAEDGRIFTYDCVTRYRD